jgi:hypothetical protein
MIRNVKLLWLVHLVGNLLLLALAWLWLSIPDARAWQLGTTAVLGLLILFGILWLHGSTFRFFADEAPSLGAAFRSSPKRVPLFALWAAVWIGLTVLVERRVPMRPWNWLLVWIVIPCILLPLGAAAIGCGRKALASYSSWRYWGFTVLLLVVGFYVPSRLIFWIPSVKGFVSEVASFIVRWFLAYQAFVTAWLMLAYVSSGGTPRVSQVKTASAP